MTNIEIPTAKKPKPTGVKRAIVGALFSIAGIVFAISPILLGVLLNSPVGWFAIATLPLGVLFSIFGLVWMLTGIIQALRQKAPEVTEDAALRSKVLSGRAISLALIALPLLLIQPVLAFVLSNMLVGGNSGLISVIAVSALMAVAAGFALFYAIQSQRRKLQVMISITSIASIALSFLAGQMWYRLIIEFNNPITG